MQIINLLITTYNSLPCKNYNWQKPETGFYAQEMTHDDNVKKKDVPLISISLVAILFTQLH